MDAIDQAAEKPHFVVDQDVLFTKDIFGLVCLISFNHHSKVMEDICSLLADKC